MWRKLHSTFSELNLDIILGSGQSFRWGKNTKNEWQGVISGILWTLKQDEDGNLLYIAHPSEATGPIKSAKRQKTTKADKRFHDTSFDAEIILKDYFNLHLDLGNFYSSWSAADENFKEVSKNFKGIRILRQDPVENLFSFICSANNNIPRITSMVENLCIHFGEKICELEGKSFYTFPAPENLAKNGVEEKLRKLVFGYRAKYIFETAKVLEKRDPGWLLSLRELSYESAHNELVKLSGVGAKVADCICLMSLDKYEAIPVDTHIWQVTVKDYLPHLKTAKTLTPKIYKEIGDFYRKRFGEYAGWANTILFAADLKKFKNMKKEAEKI